MSEYKPTLSEFANHAEITILGLMVRNRKFKEALERICAIENKTSGADWDEIDEARKIAAEALGGEV